MSTVVPKHTTHSLLVSTHVPMGMVIADTSSTAAAFSGVSSTALASAVLTGAGAVSGLRTRVASDRNGAWGAGLQMHIARENSLSGRSIMFLALKGYPWPKLKDVSDPEPRMYMQCDAHPIADA